MIFEDDSYNSV